MNVVKGGADMQKVTKSNVVKKNMKTVFRDRLLDPSGPLPKRILSGDLEPIKRRQALLHMAYQWYLSRSNKTCPFMRMVGREQRFHCGFCVLFYHAQIKLNCNAFRARGIGCPCDVLGAMEVRYNVRKLLQKAGYKV